MRFIIIGEVTETKKDYLIRIKQVITDNKKDKKKVKK